MSSVKERKRPLEEPINYCSQHVGIPGSTCSHYDTVNPEHVDFKELTYLALTQR